MILVPTSCVVLCSWSDLFYEILQTENNLAAQKLDEITCVWQNDPAVLVLECVGTRDATKLRCSVFTGDSDYCVAAGGHCSPSFVRAGVYNNYLIGGIAGPVSPAICRSLVSPKLCTAFIAQI